MMSVSISRHTVAVASSSCRFGRLTPCLATQDLNDRSAAGRWSVPRDRVNLDLGPDEREHLSRAQTDRRSRTLRTPPVTPHASAPPAVLLPGLEPGVDYFYEIRFNGEKAGVERQRTPFRVRAIPHSGSHSRLRVAFGSCARTGRPQPIWRQIENARPDIFLWLGDNVYADTVRPEILAEELRRQRDHPDLRPLLASVPQLAVWDVTTTG